MAAFHTLPKAFVISVEKHQLPNLFFFKLIFYPFLLYDPVDLKIIIGLKYDLPCTFGEDLK